jgi:hypothetical protein
MRVCTTGEGSGSDLGAGGSGNEAGGGEMEYDGREAGIGAWIEQGKYIDKHNICDNQKELLTPFELLIESLSALITKHPNKEVIIGGDFNVNFEKKSHVKHQRILLDFAENHNLLNVPGY